MNEFQQVKAARAELTDIMRDMEVVINRLDNAGILIEARESLQRGLDDAAAGRVSKLDKSLLYKGKNK